MTTIYLLRHGQTCSNLWHKIQGGVDSPLTEEGINQAKEMGRYFKENNLIKLMHQLLKEHLILWN
jgi:broad specificity phosphatase PhoE